MHSHYFFQQTDSKSSNENAKTQIAKPFTTSGFNLPTENGSFTRFNGPEKNNSSCEDVNKITSTIVTPLEDVDYMLSTSNLDPNQHTTDYGLFDSIVTAQN